MGKINLGFDFVTLGPRRTRTAGCSLRLRSRLKVRSHLHRFMFFNGTGVSLFFRDAYKRQHIENGFTFDL
jgi:hypothetical protein